MDEKPPSYDDGNTAAPVYPPPMMQQHQQVYPPMMQQQAYPATQQQQPPRDFAPQKQSYPPLYSYPPSDVVVAPPPYDDGRLGKRDSDCESSSTRGDVEADCPIFSGVVSFDEKSVRLGFIRKVFAILALQMAVTIAMIAWFLFHEPTKNYIQSSFGLYIASYILFFVLYIVLACCPSVARKHPLNLILLSIFTLSLGYLVAAISSFHDTKIVLAAFGITILCTLAVVIFASQTKYDFTRCSGILFCLLFSLILFGIFAGVLVPSGYMRIINVVYAALGALVFMGFLAFDIQTLMGGKKYELSPEDYVYAALQLYVDITYIFLFVLQLVSGGK